MLKLDKISKVYGKDELQVNALKEVSLEFKDGEFVSILGPSGCGKTTMLNIIGGLDQYTSGDIIIDGVSTKQYKDTDWDNYRNNNIGFVFQNYYLIPHQNVLDNIELAMNLSGVSKSERKARALAALEKVGLSNQAHKRPNQLSSGQCQRVAIARAIANNPTIILADEPTGALDGENSVQIMNLLKEVAGDKLIIMVTHNPELAYEYSTRIVKMRDGTIVGDECLVETPAVADSNIAINGSGKEDSTQDLADSEAKNVGSLDAVITDNDVADNIASSKDTEGLQKEILSQHGVICSQNDGLTAELNVSDKIDSYKNSGKSRRAKGGKEKKNKTSLTLSSAVKLSIKNLFSKKGRTLMTAVASSIGIICIALVLSLNSGFNMYISNYEKNSLSAYPLVVDSGETDLMKMFEKLSSGNDVDFGSLNLNDILSVLEDDSSLREAYTEKEVIYIKRVFSNMINNAEKLLTGTDITYFKKYLENEDTRFDTNRATVKYDYNLSLQVFDEDYEQINPFGSSLAEMFSGMFEGVDASRIEEMTGYLASIKVWDSMVDDADVLNSQYEVVAGELPRFNEEDGYKDIVLVVDKYNQITDSNAFALGEVNILDLMLAAMGDTQLDKKEIAFEEFVGKEYTLLVNSDYYVFNPSTRLFDNIKGTSALDTTLDQKGIKLRISGILREKESDGGCINGAIGYTQKLAEYVINYINSSQIAIAQQAQYMRYLAAYAPAIEILIRMERENLTIDHLNDEERALVETAQAAKIYSVVTGEEMTTSEYNAFISKLGVKSIDKPTTIYFYPNSIEDKNYTLSYIEQFNKTVTEKKAAWEQYVKDVEVAEFPEQLVKPEEVTKDYTVTYKDDLSAMVSSMERMVSIITNILIAVTCIAVVVSLFMIAILMYTSVQDRTKEIGILRSIGARKIDVVNIFNTETSILGLVSGCAGVFIAFVLKYPINILVKSAFNISEILQPQWWHALTLILGAVVLTVASGFIPAIIASKKNPVNALRSD